MKRILLVLAVVVVILVGELIFPIQVFAAPPLGGLGAPPAQGPVVGKYYELLRGLNVYHQATMTAAFTEFGGGCTLKVLGVYWAEGVVWVKVAVTAPGGFSKTGWILEGLFHNRAWLRLIQVAPAAPAPAIPLVPNPNLFPPWAPCWPWRVCPGRRWA